MIDKSITSPGMNIKCPRTVSRKLKTPSLDLPVLSIFLSAYAVHATGDLNGDPISPDHPNTPRVPVYFKTPDSDLHRSLNKMNVAAMTKYTYLEVPLRCNRKPCLNYVDPELAQLLRHLFPRKTKKNNKKREEKHGCFAD